MYRKYLCLVVSLVVFSRSSYAAPSVDWIPVASQFKSLVQVISGDKEGARKTQENFVNTAPVASQVEHINGDDEAARRTQKQFLKDFVGSFMDNTPIVGHIKGAAHMIVGDMKRGEEILKGASAATAVAVGGMVGGPAGAVAAGAVADGIITAADSAVKGHHNPYGVVEYVENFEEKTPKDHAKAALNILATAKKG